MRIAILLFIGFGFISCGNNADKASTLFTELSPKHTGIHFSNDLTPREDFNMYVFKNYYNGGGVGIGDVNNDGLQDIYLTGNQVSNRLYINKGDLAFEDVTEQAGVACDNVWSTGVSMVDINADGWLDIYVCKSGPPEGANRHNELFINNKDGTFSEEAKTYGLDDLGLSTHAAFFDYDRDGDLDCYLLNNSIRSVGGYDIVKDQREIRDPEGGNKLFENQDGLFVDVSEQAGIYGSNIGFGLGITVGDVNDDGWPDLFVSNDFFERDYLYINNQDGTFTDQVEQQMTELSFSSMGADMADLNNDGRPEIFVTDMLPRDNARQKTKMAFESWNKYQLNVQNGYHHQFPRNVLQLNNGNGSFSEIGRMAGVHATDWSWGALIFDMDNDGLKDIFVANGIGKDLTDLDYVNYYASPQIIRERILAEEQDVILSLMEDMPSVKLANYAFLQSEDLSFQSAADSLGLGEPSFSNGSAYGDLDNDGDLDLVVNNVNDNAFIYRNNSKSNFLSVNLNGSMGNTQAIGSTVRILSNNGTLAFQEVNPFRGFQSTVDARLTFGLGEHEDAVDVVVTWPNGEYHRINGVGINQRLEIEPKQGGSPPPPNPPAFYSLVRETKGDIQVNSNQFFEKYPLLFTKPDFKEIQRRSEDGFTLKIQNNEDFYKGEQVSGQIIWDVENNVQELNDFTFPTDALFTDFDNDGDDDLIIVGHYMPVTMYINEDGGYFPLQTNQVNRKGFWNTIEPMDVNRDGYMDYVVGNSGVNTRLKSKQDKPVQLYMSDFDNNGSIEHIVTCYNDEKSYPLLQLRDLQSQIPQLKKKFQRFADFSDVTIMDIFTANQIKNSEVYSVNENRSGIMINNGELGFDFLPLPHEAQRFPVHAIGVKFGGIILGGNDHFVKPEIGINNAGKGLYLSISENLEMHAVDAGFRVNGEVREIRIDSQSTKDRITFITSDGSIQVYEEN